MMTWLLIFGGGLLGSSHCVGMCGGFVLALGLGRRSMLANLGRQIVYALGRVFTYTFLGTAAGFGGQWLSVVSTPAVRGWLAIIAGVILLIQALHSLGWLPRRPFRAGAKQCMAGGLFAGLMQATRTHSLFLAGMINGLLPCGLLYGFIGLAASTGDFILGGLTMLVFGLGTIPVLVLLGCGASLLAVRSRQIVFRLAAGCVLLTGALSIVHGTSQFTAEIPSAATCPLCAATAD